MLKFRLLIGVLAVIAIIATDARTSRAGETALLNIALGALGTEAVDPILALMDDKMFNQLIYASLFDTDLRDKELSMQSGVAEDWEYSKDRKTLTVILRKGMKFHNGKEITAEDVVFSLNRTKKPETRLPYAIPVWESLKEIEIVNDHKIVFHLDRPSISLIPAFSTIFGSLGAIVPKEYLEKVGDVGFSQNPIGAGPYRLTKHDVGSLMVLEAFDDYHLGRPLVRKIQFNVVPEETTRIAMLKTGQADIIDISRGVLPEVKKEGFNVFSSIGQKMLFLVPHGWPQDPKATLNDVRVREALFTSINRKEIADYLMSGEAAVTGSWSYFGGGDLPPYPYEPDAAVRKLQQAGYDKGDLELTLYVAKKAGLPEAQDIGLAVAASWERIGVKVKVIAEDFGTLRPRLVKRTAAVPSVRLHAVAVAPLVLPNNLRNFFGCPEGIVWGMCDLEVDELRKGLEAATSADQYDKLQKEAQKALVDRFMFDPLFAYSDTMATNKKVKDWHLGNTLYSLNFRYLGLKEILK